MKRVAPGASLHACLRSSRPNFLVLAPLCAGLAVTAAWFDGHSPAGLDILLVMIAALLAHAAVNLFNEHHDYRSGLDSLTTRTPFSGGSGSLPENPAAAGAVRVAAWACLAGLVAIGAGFLWEVGAVMLPYGLLGLLLVVAYTGWLTRRPWLCLMAPGAGFGILMVAGAYQALTGTLSLTVLTASLVPTLLVSALLLVNQLPDIEPDRRVGRDHLAIRLGALRAARLSAALVLAAFAVIPLAWLTGALPAGAWLMWLVIPAAVWLARGLWCLPADVERGVLEPLLPLMGLKVGVLLGSLILLNAGLLLAA
ncbi:prenyltransferase [Halomonas chromatireducens]|uniref:1,4-dihydroxy-2-naphthoate octaprenyltransferase n=1 Tax=Halomonas chromatireducens TaxID=507626 RepID=A0A0X8HE63_9GAMM|nr:prenyltransferase [Halomonas chromatireducens]AMD01008.1 1,4-dihydroxy-2-naphthoate octaprenyltransferase [Halomonas chromatireducens]